MRAKTVFGLVARFCAITAGCLISACNQVGVRQNIHAASTDDVWAQLKQVKSNTTKPHHFDFFIYFADGKSAMQADAALKAEGFETKTDYFNNLPPANPWLCLASRNEIPTEELMNKIRSQLTAVAVQNKGKYDEWETQIEK